nr:C-type lectin [Anadara broughtonii]
MLYFLFLVVALFGCSFAEFADSEIENGENGDSFLLNSLLEERDTRNFCPEGWIRISRGNKCYFLGKSPESWGAAKKKCENYGGELVNINGKKESNDLVEYLVKSSTVWVGDGSVMNMRMTSNCRSLSAEEGIEDWESGYCSERLKYICERPVRL